jgi:hypothetical protein
MLVDDIMKKISDPNAKDLKTLGWPKEINNVVLDDIEHSNSRMLGPLLVLEKAWTKLKFDNFLSDNNFTKSQINAAKVVIYNRIIAPQSENMLTNWMHTTCLSEIFNENEKDFNSDRFYSVEDKLLSVKEKLEEHLSKVENTVFNLENKMLLYDVTNSYFESNCKANSTAKCSQKSKENRIDCPLLTLESKVFSNLQESRSNANIFITILAYHFLCYIEQVFKDAAINITWNTIKKVLSTHGYCTIRIPTNFGITYEVRKPGKPDEVQLSIYNALNIDLSKLPVYKHTLSC